VAIAVTDVISECQSILDAEGTNFYSFNNNFKPAINYAIRWSVSVINRYIGINKFTDETFRELSQCKVWQTSGLSRIQLNPADLGHNIWTLLSVIPEPDVIIVDNTGLLANLPPLYYNVVAPFAGAGVQSNSPIVSQKYNATGNATLSIQQSTLRPELAMVRTLYTAKRLAYTEVEDAYYNPYSAGYKAKVGLAKQYAYVSMTDYTTTIGGYTLSPPQEIQVLPEIPNALVAITYLKTPDPVVLDTDIIPVPSTMLSIIVDKAMQFINMNQNLGLVEYQVQGNELLQLTNALTNQ
jgi:hypothetical protein